MPDITSVTVSPSSSPTIVTLSLNITAAPAPQPSPTPTPTPKPAKMLIGTNVCANDRDNGCAMFADICKRMSGWFGVNNAIVTYDANGYPSSVAAGGQAAAFSYIYAYPTGVYKVAWKGGQNAISIQGKTLLNVTGDEAGGFTATVALNSGDRVELRTTGGLTALSIMSPDAKPGQMFRDDYLNALKPYKVLRVMDLQRVNGIQPSPGAQAVLRNTWANRTLPTNWDQTSNELAAEYCAELCKEAGLKPWVCIPYGADDAYINGLANVYKAAGFTVADFEYGNENWNSGAQYQGNQIRTDAVKLGTYGTDPNTAGARYAAYLTARAGKMVKAILPSARIIFGAQMGWNQWAADGLHSLKPGDVDALAIAPYFEPQAGDDVSTADKLVASCKAWIAGTMTAGMAANASVATAYGCDFCAYEGGQSLDPVFANAPPNELQWSADISPAQDAAYMADPTRVLQLDPRMGDLYDAMFAAAKAAGLTSFCHFMLVSNWGRSGFWGLKQTNTDAANVKTAALDRAIAANNQ